MQMSAHSINMDLDAVTIPILDLAKFFIKIPRHVFYKQLIHKLAQVQEMVKIKQAWVLQLSIDNACLYEHF